MWVPDQSDSIECRGVTDVMGGRAARSIEDYLEQLRAALRGLDAALIQEALDASAEHLRAEVAASPDLPEGEVLALISSTYGAPEDVADVYRLAQTQN
jgi:uncharacterized membrane protein